MELTDKGAKLAGYAEEQLEMVEDELLKDLEKKEVKKFIKLLTTIRKSLD